MGMKGLSVKIEIRTGPVARTQPRCRCRPTWAYQVYSTT